MRRKKTISPENILILGLGGVGYYLAKRLVHEEYEVTVIESQSGLIRHADGNLDARLIKGNAMSIECWREADAKKMDYLIAVTDNDAVNMLSSMIADRFGIKRKIARVRSLEFGNKDSILNAKDLKIDLIIHPEELAAQEIVRLIKLRAGNDIIDVAEGQIQVMATRIHETSPLAHKKLKEISHIHHDFPFRVVAVARGITTIIPGGEHELLPQDQVFFMASNKNLSRLMELTGIEQQQRHRVMILGGGLVGRRDNGDQQPGRRARLHRITRLAAIRLIHLRPCWRVGTLDGLYVRVIAEAFLGSQLHADHRRHHRVLRAVRSQVLPGLSLRIPHSGIRRESGARDCLCLLHCSRLRPTCTRARLEGR